MRRHPRPLPSIVPALDISPLAPDLPLPLPLVTPLHSPLPVSSFPPPKIVSPLLVRLRTLFARLQSCLPFLGHLVVGLLAVAMLCAVGRTMYAIIQMDLTMQQLIQAAQEAGTRAPLALPAGFKPSRSVASVLRLCRDAMLSCPLPFGLQGRLPWSAVRNVSAPLVS